MSDETKRKFTKLTEAEQAEFLELIKELERALCGEAARCTLLADRGRKFQEERNAK
jgi:diadenosine tetraphosphate (Ap4A) HIT family hydrolase